MSKSQTRATAAAAKLAGVPNAVIKEARTRIDEAVSPDTLAHMPDKNKAVAARPAVEGAGRQAADKLWTLDSVVQRATTEATAYRLQIGVEIAGYADPVDRISYIGAFQVELCKLCVVDSTSGLPKNYKNLLSDLRRVHSAVMSDLGHAGVLEILEAETGTNAQKFEKLPRASNRGGSNKGQSKEEEAAATKTAAAVEEALNKQAAAHAPERIAKTTVSLTELKPMIDGLADSQIEGAVQLLAHRCKMSGNPFWQEFSATMFKTLDQFDKESTPNSKKSIAH